MRVTVPEGVLVRQLGGQSVLLHLGSETYFGLDEVGTRMWAALTGSGSTEAALAVLLEEYEVEPERLRADLAAFVRELTSARLLEVSD